MWSRDMMSAESHDVSVTLLTSKLLSVKQEVVPSLAWSSSFFLLFFIFWSFFESSSPVWGWGVQTESLLKLDIFHAAVCVDITTHSIYISLVSASLPDCRRSFQACRLETLTQRRLEEASLDALLNVTKGLSQGPHAAADHLRSPTATAGGHSIRPELLQPECAPTDTHRRIY